MTIHHCDKCGKEVDKTMWKIKVRAINTGTEFSYELCSKCTLKFKHWIEDKNCQFCDNYKDGYCDVLDMKPCYPEKGCDYFNEKDKLKKDTMQILEDTGYNMGFLDGYLQACYDHVPEENKEKFTMGADLIKNVFNMTNKQKERKEQEE